MAVGANIISALAASAVLASLLSSNGQLWGTAVWRVLTGIAVISAAVGPVLGLNAKFSQMEKAALGHSIARDRLHRLISDLKMCELDDSHLAREREIDAFVSALTPFVETPLRRLREECWKTALDEYPSENAWMIV